MTIQKIRQMIAKGNDLNVKELTVEWEQRPRTLKNERSGYTWRQARVRVQSPGFRPTTMTATMDEDGMTVR